MQGFNEKNLGYFGENYELKVLNQIIGTKVKRNKKSYRRDCKFGRKVLPIISSEHFTHQLAKRIIVFLKNYFKKSNDVPYYDTIKEYVKAKVIDEIEQEMVLTYLDDIESIDIDNENWIKENTLNFVNTKNLYNVWKKVENDYIKRGKYNKFNEISQMVENAIVELKDDDRLEAFVAGDYSDLENVRGMIVPTGIKKLDEDMNGGLGLGELALLVAGMKVGKAQPNNCKVYTPKGYKLMGQIKVGDKVLGSDGRPQNVVGVFPQGKIGYYKIEFSDNTFTYSSKDHLWAVESLKQQERNKKNKENKYQIKKLSEIIKNYKRSNGQLNYRIPKAKAVSFEQKELNIHPYVMGIMIGDSSMKNNFRFTTSDIEVVNNMKTFLGENYFFTKHGKYDYYIKCKISNRNLLKEEFNDYGLLGLGSDKKFIPKDYLYSSIDDRLNLLRGLIDSDGYISKKGKISYSSTSKKLVEDFRQLVLSLGGFCSKITPRKTKYKHKGILSEGKTSYRVNVSFTDEIEQVSYLSRKQCRYKPRQKKAKSKYIKNITYGGKSDSTCIKVSNPDELYVTDDFILTHNTTFASLVANNAALAGFKVLQIYFEDTTEQVKMKHRSKFTGMHLSAVTNSRNKTSVGKRSDRQLKKIREAGGCLVPLKLDATNTTVEDIRKVIVKAKERGVWFQDTQEYEKITFDLVLIDYVDKIKPRGKYDKDWGGDKEVMSDLEKLCSRKHGLGFACWAFTQGGRSSLNSNLVAEEDVGGSIRKLQIAHFIASISKTIQQRPQGRGTFAILGSRIGRDGIIYKDCIFDNGNMKIQLEEVDTLSNYVNNDVYEEEQSV